MGKPIIPRISLVPPRPRATAAAVAALAVSAFLTGCGVVTQSAAPIASEAAVSGKLYGGQQPIAGATISLYAPGTSGYGSAPTLIVSTTTGADGSFSFPRPYNCPATSPITYILTIGGNPGAGANPAIGEAALLPACANLTANTSVIVSEATTVAAAYALAPFAAISPGTTNIGTSATNILGLANVLGPANNLVNVAAGQANAANAIPGMILPTAEVNTLADILSACVNTNTVENTSTTCATLFAAATPPGGSAPTDTFQAAIDVALNPGNNAAALFTLASAIAPFQPELSAAPSDFAIGIDYTGGPIANGGGTQGLDIDAQGDAWTPVFYTASTHSSVAEISPSGSLLSGSTGFASTGTLGMPLGLAIDGNGLVFVADMLGSDIAELNSSGAPVAYLTPPSLTGPTGVAIDNRNSTLWVTDTVSFLYNGNTATHMSYSGLDVSGSPYNADGPISVAINPSEDIWMLNSDIGRAGNGYLTEFTPSGPSYTSQNFYVGSSTFPFDLALDHSGNVWVSDFLGGITEFAANGAQISAGYQLNPVTSPSSIIVDGLGRVWISNTALDAHYHVLNIPGSVAVLSNAGTLLSTSTTSTAAGNLLGYTAIGTIPQQPYFQGLKIDASGNLWITGYNATGSQVVAELVGIAAPVTTPVSVAAANNLLGVRP